ncbi:uncharacterized protein LOC142599193 [Balearica regulorum gibbericeps]|uniref:uncharacterized protein LOC142599193 n=1 Tax=Balearica regulorum gibbericeps TaxID=100784 RepID=UPI003F638003
MLIQTMAALCFGLMFMILLCWGSYFVGRMKELGSMLVQTMVMCMALASMLLLCWGSYLVEMMGEYISLSLPAFDVDGFIMQAPKVLVHPYVSSLILLIHTAGILRVLWSLVLSWFKGRQLLSEAILKRALRQPVPGWQGVWKDLGRFLGRLSPPIAWDFTPEQASNPSKLTRHLIEGCLAYPNENQQLLALYWGLAWAYRATVQNSQRTVVEEGTQTAAEDTVAEIGTQTVTATVIAPVVKKKQWTRRSTGPYHRLVREEEEEEERFEQEAGPSAKKWEEGVREIRQEAETTRSLTSSELRDMRKDYSRQPGERIAAWLLRCWDNGADSQQLEGREAQQLGSLARNRGIERGIGKETAICSLWRRLLSSVRARYPFKEDLVNSPGKWTTADEGIQYLRELAVLEVIYSDLDDEEVSKDPEDVLCTRAMWRKVIQSAPASYSNSLAAMYFPDMDTPTVEKVSAWLQNFEENLCTTSSSLRASTSAVRGTPRNQSSPAPVRGKGSPRHMPRGTLWFFLRDQGEDMRKWDGEPTFKLEARVRELRGKTAVKKGTPKKAISVVATETREGKQRSPRRKTKITSLDPGEGTSGLSPRGSDSEYSDQEQE